MTSHTAGLAAEWRRQLLTFQSRAGALDERAAVAIAAAEEQPATGAFIERHAGPHWRNLGLGAVRAFRKPDGTWEEQEAPQRAWSLLLPVIAAGWSLDGDRPLVSPALNVVDLIAIDPDGEGHVSTLTGAFDGVLGLWAPAVQDAAPLRLFRSPLAWLREAAKFPNFADPAPEPVCICWPDAADAKTLLLHAGELICEDDAHAAALDRRIDKLRRAYLPPKPRLRVWVDDDAASEAA
jgi:hypothetical protein